MCCLYHIINFFWVFTTHFYHSWLLWVWLVFQKTVSTPQYYLCILREHKAEQHQRWCHDGHDVHSESTPSIRIICIYHKRVCIKCLHLSEWVNVKCECVFVLAYARFQCDHINKEYVCCYITPRKKKRKAMLAARLLIASQIRYGYRCCLTLFNCNKHVGNT